MSMLFAWLIKKINDRKLIAKQTYGSTFLKNFYTTLKLKYIKIKSNFNKNQFNLTYKYKKKITQKANIFKNLFIIFFYSYVLKLLYITSQHTKLTLNYTLNKPEKNFYFKKLPISVIKSNIILLQRKQYLP